jgi:DNA-binding response OmpR family regulator
MGTPSRPESLPASDDLATVVVYHGSAEEAGRLANILQEAGYHAVATHDARTLRSLCEREKAEVILLDVRPGKASDFQLCRRLTQGKRTKDTPVILAVSPARGDELEKVRQAGGTEILLKPIRPVELLRRVGMVARLSRLRHELASLRARLRGPGRNDTRTKESRKSERNK